MDESRFDEATRRLAAAGSRRWAVGGVVGGVLGGLLLRAGAGRAAAKNKGKGKGKTKAKTKGKPLVRNQFGCVDVGHPCRGQGANCCSGICEGTAPKPGANDTSRCVGHNQDSCRAGTDACVVGPGFGACGLTAACFPTTGKGTVCAEFLTPPLTAANCQPCNRDSDCTAVGFPPGSACVLMVGPACFPCVATQNRACLPPGA